MFTRIRYRMTLLAWMLALCFGGSAGLTAAAWRCPDGKPCATSCPMLHAREASATEGPQCAHGAATGSEAQATRSYAPQSGECVLETTERPLPVTGEKQFSLNLAISPEPATVALVQSSDTIEPAGEPLAPRDRYLITPSPSRAPPSSS
jgi:hypothetical protein